MFDVGRLVTKTNGKEAGRTAVIVDVENNNIVVIDGNVKRRKCNIHHLEPHNQKFDIKKGASTEEVKKILKEQGLLIETKLGKYKKRERKPGKRPKKIRKAKPKPEKGKKKKMTEDEKVEAALKAAE